MARPPRAEAPSRPVPIRLSPDERSRVQLAARVNFQTFSQFARDALVLAADDSIEATSKRNTK